MTFSIIVLRNLISGSNPQIPASWTLVPEDSDWFSVYPTGRDGECLHVRLCASSGTVGAFAIHASTPGGISRLKAFADASSRAWTLRELRADNSLVATRIKAAWRDISGSVPVCTATMLGFGYSRSSEDYGSLAELTGAIG